MPLQDSRLLMATFDAMLQGGRWSSGSLRRFSFVGSLFHCEDGNLALPHRFTAWATAQDVRAGRAAVVIGVLSCSFQQKRMSFVSQAY
jgi:hypothetical protein